MAILFDPRSLIRVTEGADNYLIILRERQGVSIRLLFGRGMGSRPRFHDHHAWIAYVRALHPDFDPGH